MNLTKDQLKIKFAEAIEDENILTLSDYDDFKQLSSWDSFSNMLLIAMLDNEYSISVSAEHLENINNLNQLFELLISNKKMHG